MELISGVILAGGKSRRMGQNKALLELAGRPMIELVAEKLRTVVDEVIIAADNTDLYTSFADSCVPDQFPGIGTLGGIHTGLAAAQHDLVAVVGCDMPFVDPAMIRWFAEAAVGVDVVILKQGKFVEPLHALYRRSCLPAIERMIGDGRRRVISFFGAVRVRYVDPAEVAHLDPQLCSFRNVNTPEEWREIRDLSS